MLALGIFFYLNHKVAFFFFNLTWCHGSQCRRGHITTQTGVFGNRGMDFLIVTIPGAASGSMRIAAIDVKGFSVFAADGHNKELFCSNANNPHIGNINLAAPSHHCFRDLPFPCSLVGSPLMVARWL